MQSSAAHAAETSVASRTRTQTRIRARDKDNEEKQSAQSSTHVSPAMRIYRHALESIFAMLQLEDLSRVLAVCRSWSAAVRSMRPIGARIQRGGYELGGKTLRSLPPIHEIVSSPLLRHAAAIKTKGAPGFFTTWTTEQLALLAQHAPNLISLGCELWLTPDAPLVVPAKLTSLQLVVSGALSAGEINCVLTTLASLPVLRRLTLAMWKTVVLGVDLSLLSLSHSLDDFRLTDRYNNHLPLSDPQVEQIRQSLGHLHRIDVADMDSDTLRRFLQPPLTARWQDIGTVSADAHTGDLLVTLPTLTKVNLYCGGPAPPADFLSKLPLLSTLALYCHDRVSASPLLASLLPCIGLTELDLNCEFHSAEIGTLLSALTKLRSLKLRWKLESLQCFTSGPATHTLEELELCMHSTPPLELPHLFALKRLRSLVFLHCFQSPLDPAIIESFSPPCALLPLLTLFMMTSCRLDDRGQWEAVKRTGPSFEWMRARLTQ